MKVGTNLSHRLAITDCLLAVLTFVLLVITGWNTEGDKTASEPAANKAHDQAENPSKSSFLFIDMSHTIVLTELTLDSDGVIGPVGWWIGSCIVYIVYHSSLLHNDHLLLTWRSHHHWLHLHWLSCCRIDHYLLHHRLSSWLHHRLPCCRINQHRLHHWLSHWLHHLLLNYGLAVRSCWTSHERLTLLRLTIIDFIISSFIGH